MSHDPAALARRRTAYAHEVTHRYPPADRRVRAAFAKVPREDFLGPPPWSLIRHGALFFAAGDPADLYQDVLVVIDDARGINNGQPSLHAACLAALHLTGDEHALHAGAGTGYYTAILAELAATVEAWEIEADLAARARTCLAPWRNVTVHAGSAFGRPLPAADAIYVSAGAAWPDPFWLDALKDGGRLLFPLTAGDRSGSMLLIERRGAGFSARFLFDCGFIPCAGGHDPRADARLAAALDGGGRETVRSLWRTPPPAGSIWFAGDGWYLSTAPPP